MQREVEYYQNLFSDKKEYTICAFTGHRELEADFDKKKLEECVENLIKKGVKTFYNGGASGFDLVAAETVLKYRQNHEIKLVVCVPFYGQEKRYSTLDKERYTGILKQADEVIILSEHYYKGCLLRRNDYMIENADCLIAYLRTQTGGTAYTVKKFLKKGTQQDIFFV